jgi:hypothetical protein
MASRCAPPTSTPTIRHPNGRFLMIESAHSGGEAPILIENWRAKVVQAFARDGG